MARKQINHQTVLQAAIDLADKDGLDKVTLASVALYLNIKTPSLYNHIKGLKGLKKDLAVFGLEQLKQHMTEAVIGKSGQDAVMALGLAYVDFVRHHPGLYEATLPSLDILDADIQAVGDQIIHLILRVLEEYHLTEAEALHTVRGLRSIVHGFTTLESKNGFELDLDRDESFRLLLSTYLVGLKKNM